MAGRENEKGTCIGASAFSRVVRLSRFELLTSCLSSKRSEPTELKPRLGMQRYEIFLIFRGQPQFFQKKVRSTSRQTNI